MDICFIANANSPHTHRWIRPLIDIDCRVRVFSYARVQCQIAGAEVIDLTEINNTSKLRFLVWAREIHKRLRSDRPDVLHAHQIQAAGWLGHLARIHPFVVTAWGSDVLLNPNRSRLSRFLTMRVIDSCDAITVPSRHMYNTALTLGTAVDKLVLIPWGIDPKPFRPRSEDRRTIRSEFGFEPDAKLVLSPRGIRPIYNHDVVIEAVRQLLPQQPRLKLLMIKKDEGGAYQDVLEEKVRNLGMKHVVKWLPYQKSMEDLGRIYRMADILISVPSSEGYGFTVYESLASGCPTIISDLPVFDSSLQDEVQVLKVPVRDVEVTARAFQRLLTECDLRQRIQSNALNSDSLWTIEQRVDQTLRLYRSLAGQQ